MLPYSQSGGAGGYFGASDPHLMGRSGSSAMYSLAETTGSYGSTKNLYDHAANQSSVWGDKDLTDEYGRPAAISGGKRQRPPRAKAAAASSTSKRRYIIIGVIIAIIIVAIAIPIALKVSSSSRNNANLAADNAGSSSGGAGSSNGTPSGTTSAAAPSSTVATRGGNGSTVTRNDGTTFIYNNSFGGTWVSTPFDDSAQAQSDIPALNQPWDYSAMTMSGVNRASDCTCSCLLADCVCGLVSGRLADDRTLHRSGLVRTLR